MTNGKIENNTQKKLKSLSDWKVSLTEADLAKQVVCERLIDLESGNCVCIVAQI